MKKTLNILILLLILTIVTPNKSFAKDELEIFVNNPINLDLNNKADVSMTIKNTSKKNIKITNARISSNSSNLILHDKEVRLNKYNLNSEEITNGYFKIGTSTDFKGEDAYVEITFKYEDSSTTTSKKLSLNIFSNNVQSISDMKLTVSADQTTSIKEGSMANVNVNIENLSPANVKNLTVQAIIENPDKAYINGDGYVTKNTPSLSKGNKTSGSFSIRTDADFTTKTIPVKINLRYYINDTNEFKEQDEKIYVKVISSDKPVNPSIEVTKVDSMWLDEVYSGQEFQVPFEVKNTGNSIARNIKISLDGLADDKLTLKSGLSTADITSLEPGKSSFIYFNLTTSKKLASGNYLLSLKYDFKANKDASSPLTGEYKFNVNIKKPISQESSLEFRNVTFPKGAISRNATAKISFDLFNSGKSSAKNIVVTANAEGNAIAAKSVSKIKAKDINPGESAHFSFEYIVSPAAETGNYPVELKADFVDSETEENLTSSQIAGIFVKAPAPKDPNAKDNSPVPKLIIEEYHFNPEIIEAGKPFDMHIRLYNTNAKKSVRNIKIFLTSDAQENVGGSQDNQSTTSTPSTASVFTPVGSSNTFYIDKIAPGKRVDKEITLTTVQNTAAKTYTVMANFEYEDEAANKYTATEQIGVPVVQKAKLTIGEILPQSEFFVGQDTPITVDYYNTGKATLYNVMIKVSGDGLKFDTPTDYKGNFNPGSSEQFNVNVNPESGGKKKLKLVFTYEDSTGETKTEEVEYEFDVTENAMPDDLPPTDDLPSNSSKLTKIFGGLALLLAIFVTTYIIIKRRKNKKIDDEDLSV